MICNKENDRTIKKRGERMRGRKDRLGRSLGEVKSLGLGEAPSEAEVFLCHTLAVRCGPQHP